MVFEVLERIIKPVSAVVNVIDEFTGKPVDLPIELILDDTNSIIRQGTEIIKKSDGQFVFTGPLPEALEYQITSDYFFDRSETLELGKTGNSDVVLEEIILCPLPCYPFPAGTTVFRGIVVDAEVKIVKDATVILRDKTDSEIMELLRTITSKRGEFVFYFKPYKRTSIIVEPLFKIVMSDGVPYLVPESSETLDNSMALEVEGSSEDAYPIKIVWGKSNSLGKGNHLILTQP